MHEFRDLRERTGAQSYIGVALLGYSDAPFELIKHPEVRDFCKRLVKLGFIIDIEPTSDFRPPEELLKPGAEATFIFPEDEEPPEEWYTILSAILGAGEIWAISEGMAITPGWKELSQDRVREFTDEVIPRAQKTSDAVLARPWPPQNSTNN
jgi:hypothetical protein